MTNEKFGKNYKLCSRKDMDVLFAAGEKISKFPFRLSFSLVQHPKKPLFQTVISVPKRNFKKAHNRNRIKRLIRESIRKNKIELESFLESRSKQIQFSIIYSHNVELASVELDKQLNKITQLMIEKIQYAENHP